MTAAALDAGLSALGLDPPAGARHRLLHHLDLVREVNRTLNLTRITEPEAMVRDHVLDALALLPALASIGLDLPDEANVVDVGTGAGFPGIPLAILRPAWSVLLAESRGRKARFLESAVAALGLGNVEVAALRAHQVGAHHPDRRGKTDLVTARAVSDLGAVIREVERLIAPGGLVVHFKGPKLGNAERREGAEAAESCGLELMGEIPTAQAGRGRVFVVHRKSG